MINPQLDTIKQKPNLTEMEGLYPDPIHDRTDAGTEHINLRQPKEKNTVAARCEEYEMATFVVTLKKPGHVVIALRGA